MPQTVDAPVVSEPEKASFFEDLIDIFVAPAKVFARRIDSGWFLTMVLFTAVAAVLAWANRGPMQGIIDGEIDRQVAAIMERSSGANADQFNSMRGWMEFSFTYGTAIFLPIYFLCLALIVWLVGKMFGAASTFGESGLIVTWAFAPRLVEQVLVAIQGIVLDTSAMRGRFQVSLGVGRFFDPATTSIGLLATVGRIDLFTIWMTVLIGVGLVVIGKLPRSSAIAAATVIWLVGEIPGVWQLLTS